MKKACKVLLILGIVGIGISIFLFLIYLLVILGIIQSQAQGTLDPAIKNMLITMFFIMILSIGASLTVQIIALNKLKTATQKSDLTVIAILCLVLGNTIVGILMLCMKDEDLLVE